MSIDFQPKDSALVPQHRSFFECFSEFLDMSSLRKHQQDAVVAMNEYKEKKANPCIISAPTGTGKTAILTCAPFIFRSRRTLVIAPDLSLFRQLRKDLMDIDTCTLHKLKMLPSKAGMPSVEPVEIVDNVDVAQFTGRDLVLANVDKFHTLKSSTWQVSLPPDFFDLVIVDEAHHLPAEKWRTVVKHFEEARVLFLTATPYRADGRSILDGFPQGKLIYHYPLATALTDHVIKRLDWKELTKPKPKFTEQDLVLCAVSKRLQKLGAAEKPHRYQGMIITKNVAHCKQVLARWRELRLCGKAAVCHGKNKKSLPKFLNRQISVLIVVQLLREGFDHPPVTVLGIVKKVSSPVVFTQFIGRAFRVIHDDSYPPPDEQTAFIITHQAYGQSNNWKLFTEEKLIPPVVADEEDEEDEE